VNGFFSLIDKKVKFILYFFFPFCFSHVNVILKKHYANLISFFICKDLLIHLSQCILELNIGFVSDIYMPISKVMDGKEDHFILWIYAI